MCTSALIVCLAAVSISPAVEGGTLLTYQGRFVAEKGDPLVTEKTFSFSVLLAEVAPQGATVYWTLGEEGRGGWSWVNHFGRLEVGPSWRASSEHLPSLLYVREQGTSIVPVAFPAFVRQQPLEAGQSWTKGRLEHTVSDGSEIAGRETWQIDVRNAYGHQRTMWIDKGSPFVVRVVATVFIGNGEEHELRYELVSQQQLGEAQSRVVRRGFEAMVQLRDNLGIPPGSRDLQWDGEQLAALKAGLPAAVKLIESGPLLPVAQAAQQDAKLQADRSGALAALRKQQVGGAARQPDLYDLKGEAFNWADVKGKVTLLHFWDYQDSPLEEPYGQVAYVDFMHRQRKSDQLSVYGVAVHQRLSDPVTRRRGVSSVRKFRSFMNLSYPLLVDHGRAIRDFGDPRVTGAKLPLFVVIDRQGKVVHYHAGHYEVDRDRGLEELDAVVRRTLGTGE